MDFYELLDAEELRDKLRTLNEKVVYISFNKDNFIVTGSNANIVMAVEEKILQDYFLVFKILCSNSVTAIATWARDIVLIGVLADSLHDGRYIWTPATKILAWPGPTIDLRSLHA